MINIELADQLVDDKNFTPLKQSEYPILFLGLHIISEYDNQRITFDSKFNPRKITHNPGETMHGIVLTPNNHIKSIINIINQQTKQHNMTLPIYENILNQFGMSCKHTYRWFGVNRFPIDLDNLKKVCDDSFNTDKKIFQHLLCIDESSFDFQRFASLKLFILTK